MAESDLESQLWDWAATLPVLGPWVALARRFRDAVDGDQEAALRALRKLEHDREAELDKRLGRG